MSLRSTNSVHCADSFCQILGSDTYPVKEWQLLGQFEAENTGEVQEFDIEGSPPMMRQVNRVIIRLPQPI